MATTNVHLPTRYVIEDKHFASDEKFVIADEQGNVHYRVDSTLFVLGDKLVVYDAAGTELIRIRQEMPHIHPTYNIFSVRPDADEMRLASVKRTGLLGQQRLEISAVNGEYLMEKQGGLLSHEFTLKKDGNVVAVVTKDTALSKSTYWVDMSASDDEYRPFILALVIVLSCAQRLPGNPLATPHEGNIKA